jgi:hypothetical protein
MLRDAIPTRTPRVWLEKHKVVALKYVLLEQQISFLILNIRCKNHVTDGETTPCRIWCSKHLILKSYDIFQMFEI